DHSYESVIQTRGHAPHRIRSDQFFRLAEIDHRESSRAREQAGDGHRDTGADHASQEVAVFGNNIEIDGRAEVDHDARTAVFPDSRDAIDQAIRAHFAGVVVKYSNSQVHTGRDEEGLAVKL